MVNSLGIQLVDALHEIWVEVYASQPPGLQWGICRLTMELNAARDEFRTGSQLLVRILSSLIDEVDPNAKKWATGIEGLFVPSLTQGSVWDFASEAANRQPLTNRSDHEEVTRTLVLWWTEGAMPSPSEYQSGPDQLGRRWTLTRMLWQGDQTRGAVLSWNHSLSPPATLVMSTLRKETKDLILDELTRLGNPCPMKALVDIGVAHRCVAPNCSGPRGHHCGLKHKMMLPTSLNRLVDTMGLDCDLLADVLHRCRRPSITSWCSKYTEDMKNGAEGNA